MKNFVLLLIHLYQDLKKGLNSFLLGQLGFAFRCKHNPSCSQQAEKDLEQYGLIRGTIQATGRILSCW